MESLGYQTISDYRISTEGDSLLKTMLMRNNKHIMTWQKYFTYGVGSIKANLGTVKTYYQKW